ncbi:MAG: transglycosylase domain-containing protein [Crocinitomicaceae bacterium]|nr:transglycosylase domain-containing protein [Crocinitomicaceae bacterium]
MKNPLANLFKKKDGAKKSDRTTFTKRTRRILNVLFWLGMFSPALAVFILISKQDDDEMPSIEMLENPPELLASVVYADDSKTELGRYWKVNRTSVKYKDISPYVFDALIATEDERYHDHSGVDFWAIARAIRGMGSDGGASTISQQLAKLLFTLREREIEAELRAAGQEVPVKTGLMNRLDEKAKENIIAVRLEKRYTKEEIITMYLNQFDFLFNAVGVENAAKVYFSKKPNELSMEEAATLVGMVKNPGLYNPYRFQVKNYRSKIAADKGIDPMKVQQSDIAANRAADSTRAINRRNTVLNQWRKNSKSKNPSVKNYITQAQCDSLKKLPIVITYQVVDHKDGIAPHFRESLRSELKSLFNQKEKGKYKYRKKDGSKYDLYEDGLKIYTTINVSMQEHAEYALSRHLSEDLQPAFTKNNKSQKNFPFSNTYDGKKISQKTINGIMKRARENSPRYKLQKEAGVSESKISASFDVPAPMRVFAWGGDIDTIMTPNDSIRYYKNIIRAGLLSIEPSTGFVKAWVGGVDFHHFAFDHVKQGKRQVGSTMKPFVYSTAMSMGVVKPCTPLSPEAYCVDPCDPTGRRWCPRGTPAKDVATGLAQSSNPTTVAVMSKMGACSGPVTIAKILSRMNIKIPEAQVVPSMCLGTPDMSLFEMVGAQSMFVNGGIYVAPQTVIRIEDRNGNVIYSADPYTREVMNPSIAFETLKMMKGVVTSGTSTSLRWHQKWGGITHPTAGKTGTTQGNSDCWFMGLTPDLVTGVWAGGEDKQVRFRSMTWGQGARAALPIYGYYMQKIYDDPTLRVSTDDFEQPIGYDPELFECEENAGQEPDINPFGI